MHLVKWEQYHTTGGTPRLYASYHNTHPGSLRRVGVGVEGSRSSTAIGFRAKTGVNSVALGRSASALPDATIAIGPDALAGAGSAIDFGNGSAGTGTAAVVVVIGNGVASGVTNTVVIGCGAKATATGSTAIGKGATAGDGSAVAIGQNVNAAYFNAIGSGTSTTVHSQVQVGARHIDLSEISSTTVPTANGVRLFVRDNGAGKTELCVRFATGNTIILAAKPRPGD